MSIYITPHTSSSSIFTKEDTNLLNLQAAYYVCDSGEVGFDISDIGQTILLDVLNGLSYFCPYDSKIYENFTESIFCKHKYNLVGFFFDDAFLKNQMINFEKVNELIKKNKLLQRYGKELQNYEPTFFHNLWFESDKKYNINLLKYCNDNNIGFTLCHINSMRLHIIYNQIAAKQVENLIISSAKEFGENIFFCKSDSEVPEW